MNPNQPHSPSPAPAPAPGPALSHSYVQDFQTHNPAMSHPQGGVPDYGQQPMQPGMMPGQAPPAPGQPAAPAQPVNNNSTQNALQIAEIRDGIVIMNDGSFRSVIMAKSINFDLMSPQEREAVEYSYQGFLNSLYFPIQIFIHSQKVDLRPYIQKLDKIRSEHDNMLLALLMEDYIGFMDELSMQTNIMDKKFYIVIPYFAQPDIQKALTASKNLFSGIGGLIKPKQEQHVVINEVDLEKAKTELRNRVQSVLAGLLQCGVQGLPLDTQELIELYYDVYNPDTATRQQLKNFNDLNAPVITKGDGMAAQPNLDKELV
ncbi:MAG: hypothetical protein KIH63_001945 [Candidatus Saccharibacteria bacterium]|nr:hypothetical protein [Candidatus Saccharibacteria bacterium]